MPHQRHKRDAAISSGVAIVLVVVLLIVGVAGGYTIGLSQGSRTTTTFPTTTVIQSTTVTTTVTTTATATILTGTSSSSRSISGGQRVYKLTFQQSGACGSPPAFLAAWSVTLGNNWTEVEPSNATLPISDISFMGSPQFVNRSAVIFSVADGIYSYNISPEAMLGPSSGNVIVKGADVIV
jgi:cytoskeletal protein RodZ